MRLPSAPVGPCSRLVVRRPVGAAGALASTPRSRRCGLLASRRCLPLVGRFSGRFAGAGGARRATIAGAAPLCSSGALAWRWEAVLGAPGLKAAPRRAAARAAGVRAAAVGPLRRHRDPGPARWKAPPGASLDQDLICVDFTIARRRALGEAFVFDLVGLSGAGAQWSPLHAADTWDGALEFACGSPRPVSSTGRSMEGADFWLFAAEQRLAPLLYAAAVHRRRHGHGRALGPRPGHPASPTRRKPVLRAAGAARVTRLRRRAGLPGPGRPDAHLDRGHRADPLPRLPVRTRRPLGGSRARSLPTGCSTDPRPST